MILYEILLYCWLAVFGACVGSFINVVAFRMAKGESFVTGRSHCPACGQTIRWHDLVPVLSWLALKGRCRDCKAAISARYPLAELCCGALAALCWLRYSFDWSALLAFCVSAILLAVTLIDFETMEIPNRLVLALVPFAIAAIWIWPETSLLSRGIGFFTVSVPMLILAFVIPGAFGGGDIKLMAVCGFLLGWENTALAFFAAILTGGGYAVYLLATGKSKKGSHIAFGPYLCLGTVMALLYGGKIIRFYLGLYGL